MTHDPDDKLPSDDHEGEGREGYRKLDEDAAWRAIVENYGAPAVLDEPIERDRPENPTEPPEPPADEPKKQQFTVFDKVWNDPLETRATWDDEGHFVPPEPPPLPRLEPRRKAAWLGLFGSPTLLLVGLIFSIDYPQWFSLGLVAGFIGGFGYLVATMPRSRYGDGSGDDGAVV